MKILLHFMGRVLITALFTFGGLQKSVGQEMVLLKGLPIQMYKPAHVPQAVLTEAPKFAHRQYWILQNSEPLTSQQVANLAAAGILLGTKLSTHCQIASLPVSFPLSKLDELGFTGASPYQFQMKCSQETTTTFHRVAANVSLSFQVLPHVGIKEDYLKQNWNPAWGALQSVWHGRLSKLLVSCTMPQLDSLSHSGWVQWIEPADGEIVPLNSTASASGRINCVKAPGFGGLSGLDGSGVTVAVGDGGMVEAHADLEGHQENLTYHKISSFGNHQDHVSGTVGGAGLLEADKEGMAPKARIVNAQTSFVISNGVELRTDESVVLTNNSYGINLNCNRAGTYSATSAFIDDQLNANIDLLHVFAAGNQGYQDCGTYPTGFRTIAEGYPVSKNVLTVGAVLEKDQFAWYSSSGPAKDGRVKPELVVDGNDLASTVPFDAYEKKSGTSMAAPVITGTLALLVQRYRQLYNQQNPENALLKGLLCNTAEDLGLPNVDFTYGFGRANARKARRTLENQWFKSGLLASNATVNHTLNAPANAKGLKVMLVWNDPAGAVGSDKSLVNDLDLKVINGSGQTYLPWVMNSTPEGVGLAAIRNTDTLNNIEQITLSVAENESISISVSSKLLAGLYQKYWLVYEWELPELVMTYPTNNQKISSGSVLPIRWDLTNLVLTQLKLEMSPDSGQTWNEVLSIPNPASLYSEWNLPAASFQKSWFRLNGVNGSQPVFSNWVKIESFTSQQVSVQACNRSLKINWSSISSATRYEVLILNRELGQWTSKGFSTANSFILNQLENGKSVAFAIKPWKGNQEGLRSDAVLGVPVEGMCPWGQDLGLVDLNSPKSGRRQTSSDPGTSASIQISLQNFGNQSITNQAVRVYFKLPSGVVSYSDHVVSLAPQEVKQLTLPGSLDLANEGEYPLWFWLSTNGDLNIGNDSLSTIVSVLSNPAITLPWHYEAENLEFTEGISQITTSKMGLEGSFGLDFFSEEKARLKTDIKNSPSAFGTKSLVLDKKKIDGNMGNGDLIFTLNLENYPNAGRLYLDFDWLPLGSISTGNGLWIRPNDQAAWVEVLRFWSETYITGQVKNYRTLDLAPFLNGQTLSSSFQVKFTQSGLAPSDIANGTGYALDNMVLTFPSKDVSMSKLLSPGNGCQGSSLHKVKIRIQNQSNQVSQNVKVGYALPGQSAVEEIISSLPALDSLDHEFLVPVNAQLIGKLDFKVWVSAADDGYPFNDTLRNQSVFIAPVVSTYPYYQGFEATNGFWNSTGEHNSWEWGTPSKSLTIMDTAANGTQIWSTGLSGSYPLNELSYLESPCFNLSDVQTDMQFSFNSVFSTEQDYDYAWLEISEDGKQWQKVGAVNSGTNWYNHASDQWNGLRKNWEVSSIRIPLNSLVDKSKVRFRFGFSSDASIVSEGFGVDDVHLEPAFEIVTDSTFSEVSTVENLEQWTEFGPLPDRVASIENTEDLGAIALKMSENRGAIRFHENVPYLDRNFFVKPALQPTSPVKVRLYITDEEVKKLVAADFHMNSFQELGVYKYDGPNQDLNLENNSDVAGSGVFIPAREVQKVPTAGGYYLEFFVTGFSEFYIASSSLSGPDDPLAVSLISFTARPDPIRRQVLVNWRTATEVIADRFELSYSCDGKDFQFIQSFTAEGSQSQGHNYQLVHQPDACSQPSLIYRLLQFDKGSDKPSEYKTVCANPGPTKPEIRVNNPIQDRMEIHNLELNSELILVDVLGKIWMKTTNDQPDMELSTAWLPKGNYWLKVGSETEQKTIQVVKIW